MNFKSLLTPIFIFFLVSCSSVDNVRKEASSKVDQISLETDGGNQEILNAQNAKNKIEKELGLLVEQALSSTDEVRTYLASDLFFKANDASLKGDSFTASIIFNAIVKLEPTDLYLRKKYAVELIKSNQLALAKEHLAYLIEKGDEKLSSKAKLLLAGVFSALGNTDESKKIYTEIISLNSGEMVEACTFLAKAHASKDDYIGAFNVLNDCSVKSPENKAAFLYFKSRLDFERDMYPSAISNLKMAIKVDPDHFQSVILLGHIYEVSSQKRQAMKIYHKFVKRNPANFSVLTKYVDLLFAEAKYREVIPYLEKLSSIDDENLNTKVRLGVLYTEVGKVEEAKTVFLNILRVIPDSDKVLYYLASLYQQTNENQKAIEYYSKINDDSALFHESHVQIAQILNTEALGSDTNTDKLVDFVQVNSGRSDFLNVELNVILAGFHEANKEFSQAISTLEKIQKLSEFNDGHEYYLAALYERVKDFKKAEKLVNSMLAKNPNNAHALNFLGYSILERGGDMELAFNYISKAVKLRPGDAYIRDSLSWYYYKTGQLGLAYEESKKAIKLVSDDVVINKHLALIYQAMNNYDKAKEFYVEALKHCKLSSEREEVIQEMETLDTLRLPASR